QTEEVGGAVGGDDLPSSPAPAGIATPPALVRRPWPGPRHHVGPPSSVDREPGGLGARRPPAADGDGTAVVIGDFHRQAVSVHRGGWWGRHPPRPRRTPSPFGEGVAERHESDLLCGGAAAGGD